MKKIAILGCVIFLVFCAPKKTTVKTEGLEEVVVFGEDTTKTKAGVSEEPVLPTTTPPSESIVPPPITPPTVGEEKIPAPPVIPPTVTEEKIPAPPIEEVTIAPPVVTPTPAPSPTPAPAPTTTPAKVYGFRVQVFASSTEKNASNVADDARSSFGGKVYVEYVAPYYKVRVGDCLTMEDAQTLKNKALKLGYRGAFIVETMISP